MYGHRVYRELITIKDIRNDFAHIIGDDAARSFETPRIRSLCMNLKIVEHYHKDNLENAASFPKDERESKCRSGVGFHITQGSQIMLDGPRKRYTETCGLFAERFDGSGEFLIIGDEPEPFP